MAKQKGKEVRDRQVVLAVGATALTIAGSDPSGGAGLQADLKAFQQNGVYGMAVVTLITVQNTLGVKRVEALASDLVAEQIAAVLEDIHPSVIKTGAMGKESVIKTVAQSLKDYSGPVIVDPVLVSKHGDPLVDESAVAAYRNHLLPRATLLTPNRYEAEMLLRRELPDEDALVDAAAQLREMGPRYVLLKAGIINGLRLHIYADPEQVVGMSVPNHETDQTHGAGCSLASTIAARLALTYNGVGHLPVATMRAAVDFAIPAVHHAIHMAPKLGNGRGPIESRVLHFGD